MKMISFKEVREVVLEINNTRYPIKLEVCAEPLAVSFGMESEFKIEFKECVENFYKVSTTEKLLCDNKPLDEARSAFECEVINFMEKKFSITKQEAKRTLEDLLPDL